jgi:Domain of unknown function (DUF4326)
VTTTLTTIETVARLDKEPPKNPPAIAVAVDDDKPHRIQRKRAKGWKMPKDAVYVGRPTIWGNPYALNQFDSAANCVDAYRQYILANQRGAERFRLPLADLKGKNLACWCPLGQPCHADVLLEIANQ